MSKIKKRIDSEKEILFREAGREAVEAAEQNFFQPVLSVAIVIQTVKRWHFGRSTGVVLFTLSLAGD